MHLTTSIYRRFIVAAVAAVVGTSQAAAAPADIKIHDISTLDAQVKFNEDCSVSNPPSSDTGEMLLGRSTQRYKVRINPSAIPSDKSPVFKYLVYIEDTA